MESRRQYLIDRVSEQLKARGLKVLPRKQAVDSFCKDLYCRGNSIELSVECKMVNLYRASDFRAMIGDAILRYKHGSGVSMRKNSRLMLALLMKRFSRKAEDDLCEYSRKYLPDLQWIIMAEDGSGSANISGEDKRISFLPFHSVVRCESGIGQANLFSPNNQLLLKVLLLSGIDSRYWGGPSNKPSSINELSKLSGVPQPSVSSFVNLAEREGFLKRESGGFVIQNSQELLDDWGFAIKIKARRAIGLRFLYPGESEEKFLHKLRLYCQNRKQGADSVPVAVGGHLGCHLLGLGRSNVRQPLLYANGSVEDILSSLDLVEDQSQLPQLSLIADSGGKSVFRCTVEMNGIPVCDVLQCYFDVRFSYARGREQADYMYEHVLKHHIEGGR